jgi:hypothetical protein
MEEVVFVLYTTKENINILVTSKSVPINKKVVMKIPINMVITTSVS